MRLFKGMCARTAENTNPDYYKQELARIAELEGKIDQLTAHSDIERQDDKWIPEVHE